MPTQNNIGPDSDIYRAVLEYDHQPIERRPNPDYKDGAVTRRYVPPTISVPVGPMVVKETMIGPYQSITPIKAYVTRNRGRHNSKNLRIKRIERVSAWEEVTE